MKLIKIFRRSRFQFLTKLPSNNIYLKALVAICFLSLIATAVWISGPSLHIGNYAPFAQPEKRIYIILFMFLVWLLKFLMLDLDSPIPLHGKDEQTRRKLYALQNRFDGAVKFLKKTQLNQLPWYLLIGPSKAGKTTLLANSDVNFILKRRFAVHEGQQTLPLPSENCDWWVTRDINIIDVPSKYIVATDVIKQLNQQPMILWRFLLRLIKKQRGKDGINGIIIALPLPDIMKRNDLKYYQGLLNTLFSRVSELQKFFPEPIPCHLIITKCDLLPGFSEFFAESGQEEIGQAWGISLSGIKDKNKTADIFTQRFNVLIKKLNQQLLWRLHHERNPLLRPYIKDFPLQVERLKEFTADFIKKISAAKLKVTLQGVYLSSALQEEPAPDTTVLDEAINTTQRSVQLFKAPLPTSRAYFIKHFITHAMTGRHTQPIRETRSVNWKRYTAYAASFSLITIAALILGRDFEHGVKQTYAIQNNLADYRLAIQQAKDPNEQLSRTIHLLNSLQQTTTHANVKFSLQQLMSFYSQKSQQKANSVYQQALQMILIPQIKYYLGEYLKVPVNKNAEQVYAALKAYLMMGDASHFQAELVANTLHTILPKTLSKKEANELMDHVQIALTTAWKPQPLDTNLIAATRNYFTAMPSFQLGYLILKNTNMNNTNVEMNFGVNDNKKLNILTSTKITNQMRAMFTAKSFANILSQEAAIAATEAIQGNWIIGNHMMANNDPSLITSLTEELRSAYVNNYIDVWENLLANIHLSTPNNLAQIDTMITHLIGNDSPLLQLLQTLHDNTYFEPIVSVSPKLNSLGSLVDKRAQSENTLYQIFTSLQNLRHYLQSVTMAENEKKAAFDAVSTRMHNKTTPDAITQLRLVAEKSPEPIKSWLEKIANDAWRLLMHDAVHYIDITWNEQVMRPYQADIVNRYPFNASSLKEVEIKKFISFFGSTGTVLSFYNDYLQPFVDTSTNDWRWKTIDNSKLPFSDDTLRQIQHAMRIHQTFFPNDDNKLYLQFALQPYEFGKHIKRVKLSINNKQFTDDTADMIAAKSKSSHVITWPSKGDNKMTSVQLTLADQKMINHNFPGDWGWFKLVNQSFESFLSKKTNAH